MALFEDEKATEEEERDYKLEEYSDFREEKPKAKKNKESYFKVGYVFKIIDGDKILANNLPVRFTNPPIFEYSESRTGIDITVGETLVFTSQEKEKINKKITEKCLDVLEDSGITDGKKIMEKAINKIRKPISEKLKTGFLKGYYIITGTDVDWDPDKGEEVVWESFTARKIHDITKFPSDEINLFYNHPDGEYLDEIVFVTVCYGLTSHKLFNRHPQILAAYKKGPINGNSFHII